MAMGENPVFLDVREEFEHRSKRIEPSKLIPLGELPRRLGELATFKSREIIVYCAHGNRSKLAVRFMNEKGFNAVNMTGGIKLWK